MPGGSHFSFCINKYHLSQISPNPFWDLEIFFVCAREGTRKAVKKTCRWHVFRLWESPSDSRRIRYGCGWNLNTSDAQKRWYNSTFLNSPIRTLAPKYRLPLTGRPIFLGSMSIVGVEFFYSILQNVQIL